MPDWKIGDLKGKRKREVFWRPLDTKNKLHLTEHPTETYCFVEDIEEVDGGTVQPLLTFGDQYATQDGQGGPKGRARTCALFAKNGAAISPDATQRSCQ